MRDSREKGAGMRDQDLPFQTLVTRFGGRHVAIALENSPKSAQNMAKKCSNFEKELESCS